MSDIAQWALLVAGALALIALIMALPFVDFINVGEFGNSLSTVVSIAGDALLQARKLINNFFSPFGRGVLTGLLIWFVGKFAILNSIKILSWIYHFIFK